MPVSDPRAWSVDDVAAFLAELRLERYVDTFRGEDVDGPTLLRYSKDDLMSVGLTGPHANKVLAKMDAAAEAFPARSHRSVLSQSAGGAGGGGGERVGDYELLRVLGEGGVLVSISFRSALRVQPTPATHFEMKAGETVCKPACRNRSIKRSTVRL